ncbi:hypothetical protein Q9966_011972 [Columba livia]|nr:hypothetical protein Q9966_011972 [Columba livia]
MRIFWEGKAALENFQIVLNFPVYEGETDPGTLKPKSSITKRKIDATKTSDHQQEKDHGSGISQSYSQTTIAPENGRGQAEDKELIPYVVVQGPGLQLLRSCHGLRAAEGQIFLQELAIKVGFITLKLRETWASSVVGEA